MKRKRKSFLTQFLDGFASVFGAAFFEQSRSYISPVRSGAGKVRDSLNLAGDWQKVGGDMRRALDKAKKDLKLY